MRKGRADMPGGGCYTESWIADGSRVIGWQCFDCEVESDNDGAGFASVKAAEDSAEHHRIEVATQELIDAGELP